MSVSGVGPGALGVRQFVTLSSGTSWTVPAGVNFVNVTLIGGGGGGGYSGSSQYSFGCYGSGGQIITSTVLTTPGSSITYSIGTVALVALAVTEVMVVIQPLLEQPQHLVELVGRYITVMHQTKMQEFLQPMEECRLNQTGLMVVMVAQVKLLLNFIIFN